MDTLFSKGEIDDEFYEELEDIMISSDVGVKTTMEIS
ncbi:MAG: signal recognition particle receptor subunit alpha, partial [Clostridia bacterium]|nr:signal recognition particle receptor subunit alpha [Clostridia bacterium]